MNRAELARRMLTIPHAAFLKMLSDVRAGEGPTVVKGSLYTVKQANAAYAWVALYGGIQPGAEDCQPTADMSGHTPIITYKAYGATTRVYLLQPGQTFAGFGGSRQGLLVRQTASLIIRRVDAMCRDDEYDIADPAAWASINKGLEQSYADARRPRPLSEILKDGENT